MRAPRAAFKRTAVGLLAVAGVIYPFAVYAAVGRLPGRVLVLAGLALLAARMVLLRRVPALAGWMAPLAGGAVTLALLAVVNPPWAARAYPVVVSLAGAAAFGISLARGPSLVARMAALAGEVLDARGERYTWRVSAVWSGVLLVNAAVAACLGAFASLAAWTLWNGLLSYLMMGAVFAGEFLLRRRLRRAA